MNCLDWVCEIWGGDISLTYLHFLRARELFSISQPFHTYRQFYRKTFVFHNSLLPPSFFQEVMMVMMVTIIVLLILLLIKL